MEIHEVAVPVVARIQAADQQDARAHLAERLQAAGFSVLDVDDPPDPIIERTGPPLLEPIEVITIDEVLERTRRMVLFEHHAIDEWVACRLDPAPLRDMHGVMLPGEKGVRFDVMFERLRDRIEEGSFPKADMIRAPMTNPPPITVQRALRSGELYVADGTHRTLNALYHGLPTIDAVVVTVDQERATP